MPESVNFDRAVDYYDATRGLPEGEDIKIASFIAETAGLNADDVVLEIGIGTGRIALPLSPHVGAYYGADISAGMMRKLREKQQNEPVFVAQGDALALPYPDASFDAVIVVHVFHLVADLRAVLRELRRVLKPGGQIVHCFNRYDDNRFDPLADAWRKHQPPRKKGRDWNNSEQVLDETGWQLLREARYEFVNQQTPHGFLDAIANRRWSSTWEVTDEQLAPGIAAIKQAIDEHFDGNMQAEFELPMHFVVQIRQIAG